MVICYHIEITRDSSAHCNRTHTPKFCKTEQISCTSINLS